MGKKTTYSIRQLNLSRGNHTWYGCIYRPAEKAQHISLHTTSKTAAKAWLAQMQAEELLPPLLKKATKDIPLTQATEEYLQAMRLAVKTVTFTTYSYRLRKSWLFLESNGVSSLRGITQAVLLKLVASFTEDRKKTLRERFKTLKCWLVWCRDTYELADYEPWKNIKIHNAPIQERGFWTMEQLESILAACPTDLYRLFLGFMVYAGLRQSESLHMNWEDISPDLTTFSLIGKMDKFATLPIADKLKDLIQKVKGDGAPEGRIFPPNKLPQKSWELIPLLKSVVLTAGLETPGRIGHHKIRHSFATNLILSGADVKTAAAAMRHANVRTTLDIYTHTNNEEVRKVVNTL